jgi:hypothetical protein
MAKQQLATPSIPSLGYPPEAYERRHFNENYGSLNNFFRSITSVLGSLFGRRGGQYMNNPYGAFQDSTDQTAASTTVAYPITFNTTDYSNGVTIASNSRITVAVTGIWNLQFSLQLLNDTNTSQDVDLWFRLNGTNIANSNSKYGLAPRKSAGDPYHVIAALNYFVSLSANDYIEIVWRTTDTGAYINQYVAGTSPTRPATPSAIATMSFVSNISA